MIREIDYDLLMKVKILVPILLVSVFGGVVGVSSCSSSSPLPRVISQPAMPERVRLARQLLNDPRVKMANFHVSGKVDNATALQNMQQAAGGATSALSYYGKAPGGRTMLDARMLRAVQQLANEGLSIRVTEFAGGSHSSNSRHYLGVAVDIDYINGVKVGYNNPYFRKYMQRARELGATEVLGPGDRNHSSHIHVAWPREGKR